VTFSDIVSSPVVLLPCLTSATALLFAGSERQKASGAQGERLKEATAINKSLSALGNVIMSLVDQQHVRSSRHIVRVCIRLLISVQCSLALWLRLAS
jgi:hypothetical protein